MKYTLRDYQFLAANHAIMFLAGAKPGDRQCYAAPTGTGKSVIELAVQAAVPGSWIITPKIEIAAGLLEKRGAKVPEGEAALLRAANDAGIYTPVALRNAMLAGRVDPPPALILDEGHHDLAESWQQLHALCGYCPAVCYTATPYRGTPRGTAAFRQAWGDPVWILTYPEAVSRGVLAFPSLEILPLVDDDLIEIANGELIASQVSAATRGRLVELVDHCRRYVIECRWTRPTMFACPGREVARDLTERLEDHGLSAVCVDGDTPHGERVEAFAACVAGTAALVQVRVVSEGVDLPIRRLIDLAPSISPVQWLQQFGRITRPTDERPEYICTNRNLLRHAYLLEGCVPRAAIQAAQEAFPGNKRAGMRVIGLEAIGRLKAAELPLRDDMTALMYAMSTVEDNTVREYCVLIHPLREDPLWAVRENERADGATAYGRWRRCQAPEDVSGYASIPPRPVSEKQAAWWKRSAGAFGLDASVEPTRKVFQALPVLSDLRERL